MRFHIAAALLGGALLVAAAAPAFATPALVTAKVTFLSGPAADYKKLGTLDPGDRVDLVWCGTHDELCLVQIHGKKGWVPLDSLNVRPGRGGTTADGGPSSGGSGGGNAGGSGGGSGGGAKQPHEMLDAIQGLSQNITDNGGGGGGGKGGNNLGTTPTGQSAGQNMQIKP